MIEWDDKYSVGISIIDDEHKEFVDIINMAVAIKENNDNPEEIRKILKEMIGYALTHFQTEENCMIKFNYPKYQHHKEEHHAFFTKTIAYVDKMIEGDIQIANDLLEYVKQWLASHIQGTDKEYIDCFNRNGLK